MRILKKFIPAGILLLAGFSSLSAQWVKQTVNTTAAFRGLSVVNEKVVWASGTGGTVIRTVDGGANWQVISVPDAAKLDFRDIEAFDANTAYILSIGNGESSRIYKTTDGGATWNLQFKNTNEKAFFDAIACWDKTNCIAMSDPVDGRYVLISTADGGASWKTIDGKAPAAVEGEAAFAASGTCLIAQGKSNAFLISGGNAAHVFRSSDRGKLWTSAETPIVKGTAGSGIFSITMIDDKTGVIVGGNYEKPVETALSLGLTSDGGKSWTAGSGLSGYRSGVSYIDPKTVVAVGTNGSDISTDGGRTWRNIDNANYNSVQAKGKAAIWAVGPRGNVSRLVPPSELSRQVKKRNVGDSFLVVDSLTLSHNEIGIACSPNALLCSNDPIIQVDISVNDAGIPHKYLYTVTGGTIIGEGANVQWNLKGVKPGRYVLTTGISQPSLGEWTWSVFGRSDTKVVTVR